MSSGPSNFIPNDPNNPFRNLPAISFANFDIVAAQNAVIQAWQTNWFNLTGEIVILSKADRRYQFLLSLTNFLLYGYQQIDWSAKQNTLPYAMGGFLDVIVAIYGLLRSPRIPPTAGLVTLQFTLPKLYPNLQIIPAGTQVADTSGTNLVFQTLTPLSIPPNVLSGTISATCTTFSSLSSSVPIGTITTIINWDVSQPFFPAAINTNIPSQGSAGESDSAYASRMFIVTDSFSNAGSYGAYKFFGLKADPTISDLTVAGPEDGLAPGNVLLTVLCQGGTMPSAGILSEVLALVNPYNMRDLCANVWAFAPTGVNVSVNVTYHIPIENIGSLTEIQANVEIAVDTWIVNVTQFLAQDIDPSTLTQMMVDAGAIGVRIISPPSLIKLTKFQVGSVGTPIINYLGTY